MSLEIAWEIETVTEAELNLSNCSGKKRGQLSLAIVWETGEIVRREMEVVIYNYSHQFGQEYSFVHSPLGLF